MVISPSSQARLGGSDHSLVEWSRLVPEVAETAACGDPELSCLLRGKLYAARNRFGRGPAIRTRQGASYVLWILAIQEVRKFLQARARANPTSPLQLPSSTEGEGWFTEDQLRYVCREKSIGNERLLEWLLDAVRRRAAKAKYDPRKATPITFLMVIAYGERSTYYRTRKLQIFEQALVTKVNDNDLARDAPDYDWELDRERFLDRMLAELPAALLSLDEKFRVAVQRHRLDGVPAEEVAKDLGIRAETVRSRACRGWKILLDVLRVRLNLQVVNWIVLAILSGLSSFVATIIAISIIAGDRGDYPRVSTSDGSVIRVQPSLAPPPPTSPTANGGDTVVALSWTASTAATSYRVKRATTSGGPYTSVEAGLTGTSFTDIALANGTTYYYVVTASNGSSESAESAEASATPQSTAPGAPTGVTATPGNAQVALSWGASTGATSYTVKRFTTSGGPYAEVQTGITGTSYTNTALANGTTYYYVVSAVNGSGESGHSNEASATPLPPPPPSAPSGLVATGGDAQVELAWTASTGATSYTVRRSTANGGPHAEVQTGITGTSYTNTGLANGTTYYYVVSAVNGSGESGNSNQSFATPAARVWQSQDIGSVGLAGTGTYNESAGTHTVSGAGGDIYGTADSFRFHYMTVTGDVTITARLQSLSGVSGVSAWAKAGVMIRENSTPGSRNVAALLSSAASNTYSRLARTKTGDKATSYPSAVNSAVPSWIRLQRTGQLFRTFHSTNGTTWTEIGETITLEMSSSVLVGMAVTSHDTTHTATAVFDNVAVASLGSPSGQLHRPGYHPEGELKGPTRRHSVQPRRGPQRPKGVRVLHL